MFGLFKKTRSIVTFAEGLAAELVSAAPPELVAQARLGRPKKAVKAYNQALESAVLRLAQFKEINKLGVYGKAKLHQVLVERLQVLGYDQALAKEINRILLLKTP